MNKWEAQYHALCQGITDKEVIKNAESLVESAIKISCATNQSFEDVVNAMLTVTKHFDDERRKTMKYRPVDLSLDRHPGDY